MKPYLYIKNKSDFSLTENWKDENYIFEYGNVYMNFKEVQIEDIRYMMVIDGEVFNLDEIKLNYLIEDVSDDEFLCYLFYMYGKDFVDMLDGFFTLVIDDGKNVFFARDKLGVKIGYYFEDGFIISNSLNCIIQLGNIQPVMKKEQILEMLSIGPGNVDGHTFSDRIKVLNIASYMYKGNIQCYFKWQTRKHSDNIDETVEKIRLLVKNAVYKQMKNEKKAFLSGGIDSSILCAILSEDKMIDTYSLEYEENDQYFSANLFQGSQDNEYVDMMKNHLSSNHHTIEITQQELADALDASMYAREVFGMGDIDASLYLLCKKISEMEGEIKICSGEISDEIFGGYPWFYKEEYKKKKGIPWIQYSEERISLLNENIRYLNYQEYSEKVVEDIICTIEFSDEDSADDKYARIQSVLCMKMFAQGLMRRQISQSEVHGIKIMAPFCDVKLLEYVYNIPWKMKYYLGVEKGILRKAFEDILPDEIVHRKKNPFPKTHHPLYAKLMKEKMMAVYNRKDSILHQLFDDKKLKELIESEGKSFSDPWFGQLMSGPQLLAYLYQMDLWAKTQNVILDI